MVIKPLAIAYLKNLKLELLHRVDRCDVIECRFREASGAGRRSAGMSTVYRFATAEVFGALAEAHPNCCLGSGAIPLPNSHERP